MLLMFKINKKDNSTVLAGIKNLTGMKCIGERVKSVDQRLKGDSIPQVVIDSPCVAQTAVGLKLGRGTLRTGLCAAAAAAASASCFAARRAALLFVLGRIFGGAMLLGRALGLARAVAAVVIIFSDGLRVTAEGLTRRIAATEAARLTAFREGVTLTNAWDAGRCMGTRGGLKESFEFVREDLGTTGARNMNEVGGPCSFETRKAALLFDLGATKGAFTLATAIDSRRLCPGTPSKRPVVPFS